MTDRPQGEPMEEGRPQMLVENLAMLCRRLCHALRVADSTRAKPLVESALSFLRDKHLQGNVFRNMEAGSGFVVLCDSGVDGYVRYFTGAHGLSMWSLDPLDAIRYARERDGVAGVAALGDFLIASGHALPASTRVEDHLWL